MTSSLWVDRRAAILAALMTLAPLALHAQRWTSIGKTSSGNEVFVDGRSVHRTGALVAAKVRVVFTPPVKSGSVTWGSSLTNATFDCAAKKLAAKENIIYADARGTKVVERKVNRIPGYGPALNGSLGQVAMSYLCNSK
jgi:hypothetical protein